MVSGKGKKIMTDQKKKTIFIFAFYSNDEPCDSVEPSYFRAFFDRAEGDKYMEQFRSIHNFHVTLKGHGTFHQFAESTEELSVRYPGGLFYKGTPAYRVNHDGETQSFSSYFVKEVSLG